MGHVEDTAAAQKNLHSPQYMPLSPSVSHPSLFTPLAPTQLFQAGTLAAPAQKGPQSEPTTQRLEALKGR